ncbi:carotenoid oxygenase family protein [Gloeothece verrucosa]|uniref:Carotenoid oxygenase n=1 Tax=Gloeothece verrucosa (strain PCC 7822) TaxID=497965 RepID=E0UDT1_GLOV7|nr:carotenoid oxygenase family protein [Gloeothece verrucosa]ADN16516.1 Carotenoid oxygenase [Gloeothece verrucosa PCC 7822]
MKRREFLLSTLAALVAVETHPWRTNAQSVYKSSKKYPAWKSNNIFLQGINAPVFEEVDVDKVKITGQIPPDLEGMYVRNGPNPMYKPTTYNFPLEGDGMLHAFYFENGKVSYRNRWVQTRELAYKMFEGKEINELKFHNAANTNVIAYQGQLLALYEIGLPYQITPELETVGVWDFGGKLEQSMTAHPKIDSQTGELHFYRYSFFNAPYLHYYVANSQGKIIRTVPIEIPQPVLLHDMAITENHVIFFVCPLGFDFQQAKNTYNPLKWQPERGTKIILINRKNWKQSPIVIETEAFWVWHFMNAFEEEGNISVDFVYYPSMQLDGSVEAMMANSCNFQRLVINLAQKTVKSSALDDRNVEFPILDSRQLGKKYQFGYTVYLDKQEMLENKKPNYFSQLVQYDVINKTSKVHQLKAGCYVGEPAFAAKENGTSELDGYVLTLVYDENKQTSDLLILDPANFDKEPIATVHLPVRVPNGFHGNWISKKQIG